jgi:hypothetical protein
VSRLLQYLAGAIAGASDPRIQLHLRTRLAIYLARRGDVETVTATVAEIRRTYGAPLFAEATARANLIEGVALFCSDDLDRAIDKLRRARALGDAGSLPQVSRWASSWLAHLELNRGHIDAIQPHARELLASTPSDEDWVLSRVASTVASGLHFGDRYDLARPWYEIARQHAVNEGDDLTIDANLYNVAALRIHNIRLSELDSSVDDAELSRADMELRSSLNYDAAKSPKSFRWAIPLIETQLEQLLGRKELVLATLPKWLETYRQLAPVRHVVLALADLSVLLAERDEFAQANTTIAEAVASVPPDFASDEFALLRHRQCLVARMAGAEATASAHLEEAMQMLRTHRDAQSVYVDGLSSIEHR